MRGSHRGSTAGFPNDRGSSSLFVIAIVIATLLLVGLIVDGGRIRSHRRLAGDIAQQAARAGAQQLDEGARLGGELRIDPEKANEAATLVISSHGVSGVTSVREDAVDVEVTIGVEMVFLSALGTRTVSASRSVDAVEDK